MADTRRSPSGPLVTVTDDAGVSTVVKVSPSGPILVTNAGDTDVDPIVDTSGNTVRGRAPSGPASDTPWDVQGDP